MASTFWRALGLVLAIVMTSSAARGALWASSLGVSPSSVGLGSVNPTTGASSATFSISGGAGAGCTDLAGDPLWQGGTLWGVRNVLGVSYLAAWNAIAKTFLSEATLNAPTVVRALAIDPTNGRFYGTTDTSLYLLDQITGNATLVGAATGVTNALGFDGAGKLYGVNTAGKLVAVDKSNGAVAEVGTTSGLSLVDLAWDTDAGRLLGIGQVGGGYQLSQVNLTSGAVTVVGPSYSRPSGLAFTGLAADFDSDGTVTPQDLEIWKTHVGTASGSNTAHGDANGDGAVDGADYLAWQRQLGSTVVPPAVVAVPEPSGAMLAAVVLAVMGRLGAARSSDSTLGHIL